MVPVGLVGVNRPLAVELIMSRIERYPDTTARPGAALPPQVTMSGNHVGKTMPPDHAGITVYATVRAMAAARLLTPARCPDAPSAGRAGGR